MTVTPRPRTVDEVAHETAAGMQPEITPGQRVAAVIISERKLDGQARTVWRFLNCNDPKVQAAALREIADLIEKTTVVQS